MLKSLLTLVDGDATCTTVMETAVELATRHEADLLGMGVIDPAVVTPHEPVPLGAGQAKRALDASRMEAARREVEAGLARLAARCAAAGLTHQIVEQMGDPLDWILETAPASDLIVMSRPSDDLQARVHVGASVLRQILQASPRPVLLVPEQTAPSQSVLVAYDGSLQAVRTLQLFTLCGLAAQRELHVVSLAPDGFQAAGYGERAMQYLARHHVTARLHTESFDGDAGARLLSLAQEWGVGMLVMGAYGQPRVRELILGSVTRTVLKHSAVPVFVYH